MAHSGKTMTFATDLVPQEDNIYNLGNSSQRWKIYGDVQPYTTRIYPVLSTTGERSAWYKITFPYYNATTGSAAKWFMNSFDLHFGGGYNANPSGVAHISFYWTRAANNGAWTLGQGAAHIEGILANKIIFYYRVAEPGILYVCNSANAYNGIWLDNLYVDDTSPSLDWSTTKIETTSAITANTNPALSAYTVLSTTYLYNSSGTLKTDSNFEGKYIKGTWLYTSAATAKTSTSKLATIESDNFVYYITPANALKSAIGTTAIGAEKTPIYWDGGKFAAGTVLKNLAYKDSLAASDVGALASTTKYAASSSVGGAATNATTTANTTDSIYPVGVKSGATTTLLHDTSITMKGNAITAVTYNSTAASLTSETSTTANTAKYATLTLGNNANVSSTTAHSEGQIVMYSAATQAHTIKGTSTTTAYTHTLPNNTGLLVSLSSGTAKGSSTKPVYIPNTGIVTECSTYAGGTKVTFNGADKGASTASFYAPTAGGTAGHVLIGAGTTTAPAWYGGTVMSGSAAADWKTTFNGTTDASSTTAAAVTIAGGLGIAKSIIVGTTATITNDTRSPKFTLTVSDADKAYLQYNTTDNSIDFIFV